MGTSRHLPEVSLSKVSGAINRYFNAELFNGILSFRKQRYKHPEYKLTNTEKNFLRWLSSFVLKRIDNPKIGKVIDNVLWVYATREEISEVIECHPDSITRITTSLQRKGIILKEQLSAKYTDHTNWYSFNMTFLKSFLLEHKEETYKTYSVSVKTCALPTKNQEQLELPKGTFYKSNKSSEIVEENLLTKEGKINEVVMVVEEKKVKPTIVQDMLLLWREEIGRSFKLNKQTARYLVSAFKTKFNNSLTEFRHYLQRIKSSVYLMSKKFFLRLGWVIKFEVIDDILDGAYGCVKEAAECIMNKVSNKRDLAKKDVIVSEVEKAGREIEVHKHIEMLKEKELEDEKCLDLRRTILKKLGADCYLAYMPKASLRYKGLEKIGWAKKHVFEIDATSFTKSMIIQRIIYNLENTHVY